MLICSTKEYVTTARNDSLKIYAMEDTLVEDHKIKFNSTISTIQTSISFLLVGLFNGKVNLFQYQTKKELLLHEFETRVTCIFIQGDMYYFGSEEGKIVVFYIKTEEPIPKQGLDTSLTGGDYDTINTSIFSEDNLGSELIYSFVEEIGHNAPIVGIANDGKRTYILDMRGKITVYPEFFSYDIYATCMILNKYLFVSEKNILYCHTQEAFACKIKIEEEILEFLLSENGNLFFLRTDNEILIYDFDLNLINKIAMVKGRFVFDEVRDRIIIYDGDKINVVNSVVKNVGLIEKKMGKIKFSETKIKEKIEVLKDSDEVCVKTKYIDDGAGNFKESFERKKSNPKGITGSNDLIDVKKDKNVILKDTLNVSKYIKNNTNDIENFKNRNSNKKQTRKLKEVKISSKSSDNQIKNKYFDLESKTKDIESDDVDFYNNKKKASGELDLFSDSQEEENEESFEDEQENEEDKEISSIKELKIKPFMSGRVQSEEKILLCYNKIGYIINYKGYIEVVYQNNNIPQRVFNNNFNIGITGNKGLLFSDEAKVYFYGKEDWEKDIDNILLLGITDNFICCVLKEEMILFSLSGDEIASLLIKNPISICSENKNIALFCNDEIITIDEKLNTKKIRFNHKISFCSIENNNIYFVNNGYLYLIKNEVFIKTIKIKNNPLCVNNSHLVCCNEKLFPAPNIEYHKITAGNIISDLILCKNIEEKINETLKNAMEKEDYATAKLIKQIFLTDDSEIEKMKKVKIEPKHFRENPELLKKPKITQSFDVSERENIENSSVADKIDGTFVKKKRYNPFAKK